MTYIYGSSAGLHKPSWILRDIGWIEAAFLGLGPGLAGSKGEERMTHTFLLFKLLDIYFLSPLDLFYI